MSRKNLTKTKNTKKINRERDPIPWRYCLLTLVCGLALVVGFFFAARQHFSSMDYGIKNSKLRKQKSELEDAQRQLILDKEIALSPSEIKKAAKKLGLIEMTAANIAAFSSNEKTEKPKAEKLSDTKQTKANSVADAKTDVKKTEKDAKTEKKPVDSKNKKVVRETNPAR
jgi:uncharacterized membrane-anchored protein YhcB (DUF1043 family)